MEQVVAAAAEDGRFDVALFVYNYLNTERGGKALAACRARNMGTTLMKMDPAFYIEEDRKVLAQIEGRYKAQGKPVPDSVAKLAQLSADRATRTSRRSCPCPGAA